MSYRWISICMAFFAAMASVGCTATSLRRSAEAPARRARLASDIIGVRRYFHNNPFLSFDDQGDPNPEGFKVTYYAVSAATREGAFGDGLIRFKMYVIEPGQEGEPATGRLVKTWEFDPQQAMGWRVRRKGPLGWPYLFHLNWGDADPYGKEVRIVPEFVRIDGRVIKGSPKDLRVPVRKHEVILLDEARL